MQSARSPAVLEDSHEPRLKVNNENVAGTDLKDLRRHFRYRCERIGIERHSPLLASPQGVAASSKNFAKPPKRTQPGWFSFCFHRKTTPASQSMDRRCVLRGSTAAKVPRGLENC